MTSACQTILLVGGVVDVFVGVLIFIGGISLASWYSAASGVILIVIGAIVVSTRTLFCPTEAST